MGTFLGILTIILVHLCTGQAYAAPSSLTYQGRILKSDNTPLENSNISFQFQITDPVGGCILYEEQVNGYDMTNSGGVFDVAIGNGTQSWPTSGTFDLLDSFNNSTSLNCSGGSTYTPALNDIRRLRVKFYDGTGWKTISPDSVIRSVPFAGYSYSASKLGSNLPTDFVLKTSIPACPANSFLSFDGSSLSCQSVAGAAGGTVTNVTSTNAYLSIANGSSTPALTLNVGTTANTVAAGNDSRLTNALQSGAAAGGDLSGNYPNPTVAKIQSVAVSSAVPTNGHFFKYNGTNWSGSAIAMADVTGLNTQLGTYVTQSFFNTAVASGNCTSGQTMYWNSVSSTFACSAISISLAGDVSGNQSTTKVVALQNNPVAATAPTTGQFLKWDGTNWIPATLPAGNPGTVTAVSGTAPISVATGTSTPVISISQATTSTNGYLSSADWNAFNGKQAAGSYVTALTGDVTAVGPGSVAATIAKLQGSTLTLTAPANGQYLKYNGTAFVNSALSSSDLSGNIPASLMPAFTGDVTSSAGSTVLTLSAAGTAGTYYKVTTDSKGRVTSGSASLAVGDIPGLPWSQITSGKPTTLSGYGITDAVKNAGNAVSIQSGIDASKGAASTNGRFYFATDTQKIYFDNASSWIQIASNSGTGGTVTSVTSANADIAVATTTSTPLLTLNSGTSANQIVKLDGSAKLPAVDGSALTNLNASNLASGTVSTAVLPTIPLTKGGTGLTSAGTANQVLGMNNAGTAAEFKTITAGSGVSVTHGANSVTIATTGAPPTGTAGGDLSGTYPNPTINTVTVAKGGTGLTSGTSGGIPYFNSATTMASSAALTANGVLLGGGAGASPTATSAGAAYQPLRVPAGGGAPAFGAIDISQSAAVTGILPITNGGTGASSLAANRLIGTNGTGTVQQAVTCAINQILSFDASGNYGCYAVGSIFSGFINGGNTFGATSNLGNNDNFDLNIKTNNLTRMTVQAGGNVGIGTTSPRGALDVNGAIRAKAGAPNSADASTNGVSFENNGDTGLFMTNWDGTSSTGDLNLYVNNLVALSVLGTTSGSNYQGSVGIGTTAPGSSLEIIGTKTGAPNTFKLLNVNRNFNGNTVVGASSAFIGGYDAGVANIGVYFAQKDGAGFTNNTSYILNAVGGASGTSQFVVTGTGKVGIGTANPGTNLEVVDTTGGTRGVTSTTYSTNPGGLIQTRGARGTLASPSALLANDPFSWHAMSGYDGAAFSFQSTPTGMGGIATENWSSTAHGSAVRFLATPNGAVDGIEAMRVDQNGNVGIGTTAPGGKLHVQSSTNNIVNFYGGDAYQSGVNIGAGANNRWLLYQDTAANGRFFGIWRDHTGVGGAVANNVMMFYDSGLTSIGSSNPVAGLTIGASQTWTTANWSKRLSLGLGGSESAAIEFNVNPALKWGMGATVSDNRVHFFTTPASDGSGAATDAMNLSSTGAMYIAGVLTQSSDIRLKDHIERIPASLEKINQLNGVTYYWKDPTKNSVKQIGLIAQDVEKVFPEAIAKNDKGFLSVAYQNLVGPIVEAIKELTQKLKDQDRRVASLEEDNLHKSQQLQQNQIRIQQLEQNNRVMQNYLCQKDPHAPFCTPTSGAGAAMPHQ